MTQRKYILFVALIFTGFFALGQRYKPAPKDIGRVVNENKKWRTEAPNSSIQDKYSSKSKELKPINFNFPLAGHGISTVSLPQSAVNESTFQVGFSMLQPNAYYEQLGFFCRKEIQLQRVTTVPVKFRLGSYDYVNWLEGKGQRQ